MEKYKESLREAITAEFNAIQKYRKYAEVAEKEGYPRVAFLFKALIQGENIHLRNHARALGEDFSPELQDFKVGTTMENLVDAMKGEWNEYKKMYPSLMDKFKREMKNFDAKVAQLSMRWAKNVEKHHSEVLARAIERLKNGKDFDEVNLWVCKACGNLFVGNEPAEMCPVCKHNKEIVYVEVQF
ncbi:MAG: rubrerythrin family protein [Promethearchaeota archaeon]